jgi:lipopolysaccharide biosynthesis glycosyltransferase
MTSPLQLALASDEGYLDGLVGTLSGVARKAADGPIDAVILDCGIEDSSWDLLVTTLQRAFPQLILDRRKIQSEQLNVFNPDKVIRRLNNSCYARLLLPDLLPHLERIIYLDCDLHVDADLHKLFAASLDGALIGAVPEVHLPEIAKSIPPEVLPAEDANLMTFNSGVMLMDLTAMRTANFHEEVVSLPVSLAKTFQDQSMLNYLMRRKWKPLAANWNRQRFVTENFSIYRDSPDSVWHFIGMMKPWHFVPGHARGLMADFQRDMISSGWSPRYRGEWRPRSAAWRDTLKATRALALRVLRTVTFQ